jgi:glycosidase
VPVIPNVEVDEVVAAARAAAGAPGGLTASPRDWRDHVIYFLMVDRFNRPGAPPRHQPWDDPGYDSYQGGTFSGIQEQLPYLKALGVGALWLSPVLANPPYDTHAYHGYGIHDFRRAEPRFAEDPDRADDELRALVDAAHDQGLYVIFDIVLNHVGDVFAYSCDAGDGLCASTGGSQASFRPQPADIRWRDSDGTPDPAWPDVSAIAAPPADALAWPAEIQHNSFFRRQGVPDPGGIETVGDFASLKQLRTDDPALQDLLVRCYEYVIARFDVDGYRIDTLRYLKGDLPRIFGNAMREFALSVGKENFFTFGEVFDSQAEEDIARFIGRSTLDADRQIVGVDAALDYPLYFTLPAVAKGFAAPAQLADMYAKRQAAERQVLSSHGDATRYFVTFADNHDVKARIRHVAADGSAAFDDQVTLALACLATLPGIPCVYYGTEQGLHGAGSDPAVREALWGGPGFDRHSAFYQGVSAICALHLGSAALRYGRFYLRPVSGDGVNYAVSPYQPGVLAYSRILADEEVLVVANASTSTTESVHVIVDSSVNAAATVPRVLYRNQPGGASPAPLDWHTGVHVTEPDGGIGNGPLLGCGVTLRPMEVFVLALSGGA